MTFSALSGFEKGTAKNERGSNCSVILFFLYLVLVPTTSKWFIKVKKDKRDKKRQWDIEVP